MGKKEKDDEQEGRRKGKAEAALAEEEKATTTQPKTEKEREMVLVERKVVDEKLIRDAVLEELEELEPGIEKTIKSEEVNLMEVTDLMLSFKNIYYIDNLNGFEKLTKLQLDNNIITEIRNLDHLVSLRWLDLSFNNITKIENLDKLIHLEDLSLFNNKITKITGLDSLVNLNVLSLGNNLITGLEDIQSLRGFQKLRLLNLKGNPVCQEDHYHNTVFAYLNKLKYLDYKMIEQEKFDQAKDSKLGDKLMELMDKEKIKAVEDAESARVVERMKLLVEANVDGMEQFFDNMTDDDNEAKQIRNLPNAPSAIKQYKEKFEAPVSLFVESILATHAEKKDEKQLFEGVLVKLLEENEKESIGKIHAFEAIKKRAFKAYKNATSKDQQPKFLQDLRKEVQKLYDDLMDTEMILVEQLNDIIEEFRERYSQFVAANSQKIANTFRELADVETWYYEQLTQLIETQVRAYQKDETTFDDPDVKQMLSDRDALKTLAETSHDNQKSRIAAKEDLVREKEESTATQLIARYTQDEYERNRYRVSEINELIKTYNAEIDERLDFDPLDEGDSTDED